MAEGDRCDGQVGGTERGAASDPLRPEPAREAAGRPVRGPPVKGGEELLRGRERAAPDPLGTDTDLLGLQGGVAQRSSFAFSNRSLRSLAAGKPWR